MATIVFNNQAVDYGTGAAGTLTVASGSTVSITSASAYYSTVNVSGTLKISRLSDFRCSGTMTINSGGIVIGNETGGGNNGNLTYYGGLPGWYGGITGGGGGGGGYLDGVNGADEDGPFRSSGNNDYGHGEAGVGGYGYGALTGIITYFDNLIPLDKYNGGNGGNGSNAYGGTGAGSFKILSKNLINNGTIKADGTPGGSTSTGGGGGGGGGGTIIIFTDSESGTGAYSAKGGTGGSGQPGAYYGGGVDGGGGGGGRIIRYVGASTYSGTFSAGNTNAQSLNTLLFSDNPQAFSATYPRLVWKNQIVDFGDSSSGALIVSGTTTLNANTTYKYSYISVLNGGVLKISRTANVIVNGTVTVFNGGKIEGLDIGSTTQSSKNAVAPIYDPGTNWDYSSADQGGHGGGGAIAGTYCANYSARANPTVQGVSIIVDGRGGLATANADSSFGVSLYTDYIDGKYAGGNGSYGSGDP